MGYSPREYRRRFWEKIKKGKKKKEKSFYASFRGV